MPRAVALLFLAGCATSSSTDANLGDLSGKADSSLADYSPSDATAYADAHWDDGIGLCAEFTSRALRAGGLDLPVITYVPTLVQAFAHVRYDEYDQGSSPTAKAGDVVVYSDDVGSAFCDDHSSDELNCGHVCPIVTGGTGEDALEVDCHNHAHYHLPLGYILGGGYSTYRIYHLTRTTPPGTVPCTTDVDCNGGATGTEDVCAADDGYCIRGCHSDSDCATGTTCWATQPHWSCQ